MFLPFCVACPSRLAIELSGSEQGSSAGASADAHVRTRFIPKKVAARLGVEAAAIWVGSFGGGGTVGLLGATHGQVIDSNRHDLAPLIA